MTEAEQARAAIAAMNTASARLAARTRWPLWRHAAVGVMMGLLIAAQAFGSPVRIAADAAVIVAALVLVRRDRTVDGMFVNGWRKGRTLAVTLLMIAGVLGALIMVRRLAPFDPVVLAGIALAVMIWTTALSYLWQAVYQRELGAK